MITLLMSLTLGTPGALAHDDDWDGDRRRRRGDVGSTTVYETDNSVTVSVSPLHLAIPMFEGMGEFRTADQQSVAVIGGIGSDQGQTLYEVGGQVRQYVIGDFDTGINLGAEATAGNANYQGFDDMRVSGGPFIGGKLTLALFSVDVQGGGQVVWRDNQLVLGPLLNLNAGVSF